MTTVNVKITYITDKPTNVDELSYRIQKLLIDLEKLTMGSIQHACVEAKNEEICYDSSIKEKN